MIHIGLSHQVYNAYTGDLAGLRGTTERLVPLLG
jgi:hypothetical protein